MTAGRARGWKRATRDHALLRVLSDSDLPRLGGDDGAPREFFGITRQDLQTCAPLVCGAEADQAHNAAMRKPSQDSQLPKSLSMVTTTRPWSFARTRISSSPGSGVQSPAHTTSCPAASSSVLAWGLTHASRRTFKNRPQWRVVRCVRWRRFVARRPSRLGCPHVPARDSVRG